MKSFRSVSTPSINLRLYIFFLISTLVSFGPSLNGQQGKTRAESIERKYPKLLDGVERKPVTIWSDGTRMAGDLYLPTSTKDDEKLPAVVFVSGTGGTKKGFSARLSARFAEAGYAFLNFDYRGWGESDSKLLMQDPMPEPDQNGEVTVKSRAIRWQMDFADQVEDIRNAIAFISGEPNVDPERIGILGTSYGGGLVTWVSAHDPRIKCSAAQVPGMGGGRPKAATRRDYVLQTRQARGETEPVPYNTGAPGGVMSSYSHMRYNNSKRIGFNPVEAAELITTPMLIIDSENEELMDRNLNGKAVANILEKNGVTMKYHILEGVGHYGVYNVKFDEATSMEIEWFDTHLKSR